MSTYFWKHYAQWLNYILIFITNKVCKTFVVPKEVLLDIIILTTSTYVNWIFRIVKFTFFNHNIAKHENFFIDIV